MESAPIGTEGRISAAEIKFERARRSIGLWLGPLAFIAILLIPMPALTPEAHRLAAVLAFTLIYWICEPIPIPITALMGPSLCVLLGVAPAKTVLASFADPIIFVFIGSFLIAQAVMTHGLDRRLAISILSIKWVGNSTRRILFAFGAIAAFFSMWLSNTATTAMLLPIALGILGVMTDLMTEQRGIRVEIRELRLSRGLLLMTAYAASVGGIGTPIGTPPNLLGRALIEEQTGIRISFVEWMSFGVPLVIVMFVVLYFLMIRLHPPEVRELTGLGEYLQGRREALGRWTRGQINACIAFGVAVTLWVTPGILNMALGNNHPAIKWYEGHLPEGVIAVLAAGLLFLLPVSWKDRKFTLTWEEAVHIDWGTILLFGGGIALGGLASSTGLAEVAGRGIFEITGVASLVAITFLSILMGIVISETTSNTAAANIVIPVAIAVAKAAGVDPIVPAIGACLGASYGFMLPVSTPPNAIVYGSGMIPIPSMVKTGVAFDIIGLVLVLAGVLLLV